MNTASTSVDPSPRRADQRGKRCCFWSFCCCGKCLMHLIWSKYINICNDFEFWSQTSSMTSAQLKLKSAALLWPCTCRYYHGFLNLVTTTTWPHHMPTQHSWSTAWAGQWRWIALMNKTRHTSIEGVKNSFGVLFDQVWDVFFDVFPDAICLVFATALNICYILACYFGTSHFNLWFCMVVATCWHLKRSCDMVFATFWYLNV